MLQFGAAVGDSIKIGDTVFLIRWTTPAHPRRERPLQRHPAARLYPDVLPRRHSPDPTRQPRHLHRLLPLCRAGCPGNSQVHPPAHPGRPPPTRNHRESQGAPRPHSQQPLPLLKPRQLYRPAARRRGRGQRHPHLYAAEAVHRRGAPQSRCHGPSDCLDLSNPSRGHGLDRLAHRCPARRRGSLPAPERPRRRVTPPSRAEL